MSKHKRTCIGFNLSLLRALRKTKFCSSCFVFSAPRSSWFVVRIPTIIMGFRISWQICIRIRKFAPGFAPFSVKSEIPCAEVCIHMLAVNIRSSVNIVVHTVSIQVHAVCKICKRSSTLLCEIVCCALPLILTNIIIPNPALCYQQKGIRDPSYPLLLSAISIIYQFFVIRTLRSSKL